jgi:hypothetical protein
MTTTTLTIDDDFSFLIVCCQQPLSKENKTTIEHYLNHHTSYSAIITLALQQGVLPHLYKTLNNLSLDDKTFSHLFFTQIKQHYRSIVQYNMQMSAELIKIMHLFKSHNIQALSFKGPILSQLIYQDISMRQFGDLDILISPDDIEKSIHLLTQNHYQADRLLKHYKKDFFSMVNVLGFEHRSKGIYLELHWQLLVKNYAIQLDEKLLFQTASYIAIQNQTIATLKQEYMLLYLCIHGSKHLYARLEWICDIDRCIRQFASFNWELVFKEAKKSHVVRIVLFSLLLSHTLLKTPLPNRVMDAIHKERYIAYLVQRVILLHFTHTDTKEKPLGYFFYFLSLRETWSDKVKFIFFSLISPTIDDLRWIRLPRRFSFLYLFLRPLRLLSQYLT